MKPALFVASSSESKTLAHAVQANLDGNADVTCWDQGFLSPGGLTLDVLLERAAEFDFGVFVFSPDDLVRMRQEEFGAVRDNVLFEFGLFISKLGRRRAFMLLPTVEASTLHLPTDLAGLTGAHYDAARLDRDDARAVVGQACYAIGRVIAEEWPAAAAAALTPDLALLLRYLERDVGVWVLPDMYARGIAVSGGSPEDAGVDVMRGWRRAVRYGMMVLLQQGLVERRVDTSVTYSISRKGRRLLAAPLLRQRFPEAFALPLRPLSGRD